MSRKEKLLAKLLTGNADTNFDINDLVSILIWFGFEERKASGSHRIFSKEGVKGIINIQKTANGKAKEYQVKQTRKFLVKNKIINHE